MSSSKRQTLSDVFTYANEGFAGEHLVQFRDCTLLRSMASFAKGQSFELVRFEWDRSGDGPCLACYLKAEDVGEGGQGPAMNLEMIYRAKRTASRKRTRTEECG